MWKTLPNTRWIRNGSFITEEAVSIVNDAKDARKHVCAVGTTVLRTLESSVSTAGHLKPYDGWTNKFIFPPYEFSVPTRMISNFHLAPFYLAYDGICVCRI